MTLDPKTLREKPQLAVTDVLSQTIETAIVALCAAHPRIEHELSHIDLLADNIVACAIDMLTTLDDYHAELREAKLGQHAMLLEDDALF